MTKHHRKSEQGSAIIYVFIGVILFAAMMYSFVRSTSTSESSKSNITSAKPKAIEIMDRAEAIARVVDTLMAKGCSISELNFYSSDYTQAGSANPKAPTDGHCDVYSPKGGNIVWKGCPDSKLCPDPYLYAPAVPESVNLYGVGEQPEDLLYMVLVRKDVCFAINQMLGLPTDNLPGVSIDGGIYKGTFTKTNGMLYSNAGGNYAPFQGKTAGCIYAKNYMTSWGGEYFWYYRVLIPI